jgi:hypothetical protein
MSKPRRVRLIEQLHAKYDAGHSRPPTRKQAAAWLHPIRKAFREMKSGECDAHRGYAITRIHHADNDFARVDHCINGFVAMLERLSPEFDIQAMKKVSKKLENGVLMTVQEIDACFAVLNACEDLLVTIPRSALKDAALVEQINIEMELLGIKGAA